MIRRRDRDAGEPGRLPVAADGVDLPTDVGAFEDEPGDERGADEEQRRAPGPATR